MTKIIFTISVSPDAFIAGLYIAFYARWNWVACGSMIDCADYSINEVPG